MDPHVFRSWQSVADPEVAKVLMQPRAQRVLAPFIAGERSVGEVAAATGTSTQSVGYWVKRFTDLHLLRFTRTRPRRGRPIRCYRATAGGFFVPFEMTRASTLEALLIEQERPWTEQLYHDLVHAGTPAMGRLHEWGMCVSVSGEVPYLNFAPNPQLTEEVEAALLRPDAPALWACWSLLKLDFADAKAFQRELAALIGRYGRKRGGQDYLVRLALTPTRERANDGAK